MLELKGIIKRYEPDTEREVAALKGIDLKIEKQDMIAIVGVSGSGKTSLLNIIGLLDRNYQGNYFYEGEDMQLCLKPNQFRNAKFGYIVQDYALIEEYTVKENIEIPLVYATEKLNREQRNERIKNVLKALDISDKEDILVSKLSGGQRQRTAIARAIINNPEVILADEPTGSLDGENSLQVMNILKTLNDAGKTIILITHDLDLAEQYCQKIYHLVDGKIAIQ